MARRVEHTEQFVEISRPGTTWRFEREFLTSNWVCLFGDGCQGILAEPAAELGQGCCSLGAHLGDGPDGEAEAMNIAALASVLPSELWQHHDAAHGISPNGVISNGVIDGIFSDETRTHTRVVDGACVFLNRPGFSGGAGCALHLGALADGDEPLAWKPSVCWQLPIRVDWEPVADGDGDGEGDEETATVRRWTRSDWGEHGTTMAWCCTERSDGGEAYSGSEPVIDSLRAELTELAGEDVYVELRRRLVD